MEKAIPEPSGAVSIQRIMVGIDALPASTGLARYVGQLAAPGVQIRLVSVAENPSTLLPMAGLSGLDLATARSDLLRAAEQALAAARHAVDEAGVAAETELIDLSTHGGDAAQALVAAARAWQADLLAIDGHHHYRLLSWVEGGVSEPVSERAICSLLVVPASYTPDAPAAPGRILFAVDGSASALQALRYGLQLAPLRATVRVVYVVDRAVRLAGFIPVHVLEHAFVEEGKAALATAVEIVSGAGHSVETELLQTHKAGDDVPHAIVRDTEKWHADLIVIGTEGRRGWSRWLFGSVAGRIAHITPVPLLLVRAQPK